MDAIEAALPEDLRKARGEPVAGLADDPPPYKYMVFTITDPHASVPFDGPRFTKAAPGRWDVFCRQRRVSLASYRPLYQAVLDAELTLMAEIAFRLR